MRILKHDEVNWIVREADARDVPGARGARCLIYESDAVVRRVWTYPTAWDEMSDDDLWQVLLSSQRRIPGFTTTPASSEEASLAPLPDLEAITRMTRALLRRLGAQESADAVPSASDEALDFARARSEIRAAIRSYASELRRGGVPPERALVLLKGAVQAGVAGTRSDDTVTESLVNDGVAWCIDAYFHAQ